MNQQVSTHTCMFRFCLFMLIVERTSQIRARVWKCCSPQLQNGGFPGGSVVKNTSANAGDTRDMGSIPGGGDGNPLHYSCLESLAGSCLWCLKESDTAENNGTVAGYKIELVKQSTWNWGDSQGEKDLAPSKSLVVGNPFQSCVCRSQSKWDLLLQTGEFPSTSREKNSCSLGDVCLHDVLSKMWLK